MSPSTEEKLLISKKTGTLAIDLGNTTTVVAFQGDKEEHPYLLDLPDLTRSKGEIPSLVWFCETSSPKLLVGQEVVIAGLTRQNNPSLNRDFKRYIGVNSSVKDQNSSLSAEKAGEILLTEIWKRLPKELEIKRLVMTTPVESYRAYKIWLNSVCSKFNVDELALVDEPTAAAMGAGMPPGSKLLVCDLGGSTIDLSMVALEGGEGKAAPIAELIRFQGRDFSEKSGQIIRCAKVLGKSGMRLGGRDFDKWIANKIFPTMKLSETILDASERLKCRLSNSKIKQSEQLSETIKDEGFLLYPELKLNREEFEDLLIKNNLLTTLDGLLKKTLAGGRRNNCDLSNLNGVMVVGGGSRIPLIRNWLKEHTKGVPFLTPPPVESIAIGALSLTPGVQIRDVLQKGVFIRCWDQRLDKHIWHPLFLSGHPWPTQEGIDIIFAASKQNQSHIEIIIGEPENDSEHEVIYINGIPTIQAASTKASYIELTDISILIPLAPPGKQGEDCLKLNFKINKEANLQVEGIDLRTNEKISKKILYSII